MSTSPQPAARLDPRKFRDPFRTAAGEPRARVALGALETLWFNTGTLCNLACSHCYIESSPRNNRLAWLTAAEAASYLDEIEREGLPTRLIGFTGGEPFMNPELPAMLEDALARGFEVLVLTNAMKPMRKRRPRLLELRTRYGRRLGLRVSVDHYAPAWHEVERGRRTWQPTLDGLQWLAREGFRVTVAGRLFSGEAERRVREGFAGLFRSLGVALDAHSPADLVLFPEMDARADVPEITAHCWDLLGKSPAAVMCASSRMVVRRKDAAAPTVVACTLLPHDPGFELGHSLAEAAGEVALNHPHCARFCVLGGARCNG